MTDAINNTTIYEEEEDEEEVPYCYANGKYSAPIPCGCSQPCCVPDSDDEEEKPKCKSCGVERVVDYEDNICHTCYHKSCDEGERYCCDNEEKPKEEEKPKIVIIKKKKKKAKKLIIKTCNCITKGGRICCINDFKCSICGVCLYWKGYEEGTTKCGCHHTK